MKIFFDLVPRIVRVSAPEERKIIDDDDETYGGINKDERI